MHRHASTIPGHSPKPNVSILCPFAVDENSFRRLIGIQVNHGFKSRRLRQDLLNQTARDHLLYLSPNSNRRARLPEAIGIIFRVDHRAELRDVLRTALATGNSSSSSVSTYVSSEVETGAGLAADKSFADSASCRARSSSDRRALFTSFRRRSNSSIDPEFGWPRMERCFLRCHPWPDQQLNRRMSTWNRTHSSSADRTCDHGRRRIRG